MTTSSNWDWQAVSQKFFQVAQEAYRYAGEVKMRGAAGHQAEYDEYMAKFSVYSHLYDKSFLAHRVDVLAELQRMLGDPPVHRPTGVGDMDSFERCRTRWIRELIGELERQA